MYTIDGRGELTEAELPHLRGYRGSAPVRIGQAAQEQLQLDIYGELMDALYLSDKYGEQVSWQTWLGITRSMEWLAHNWKRADEGIWEVRGGRREFPVFAPDVLGCVRSRNPPCAQTVPASAPGGLARNSRQPYGSTLALHVESNR